MSAAFHRGDLLVIQPADGDDPEANSRQGQPCRFLRFGPTGLAQVEIEGGAKPMYFRAQDLVPVQGVLS